MFLQGLPGSVPWGVYSSYLHDVLANEKHFSQDAVGLPCNYYLQASSLFLFFGAGAALGNAASGELCRVMYRFNRAFVPVAIAIGYLVSMPLLALLFSPVVTEGVSPACSFGLHALLLFSLGVLLNIPGPALKALLLNVNRPHCRGTATAVGELFNNAGRILGPVVFTWLLRTRDRVASTLSVSNFFYISAALSFLLCYTVEEDEDAVKEYVKNIKVSPMEREAALESRGADAPMLPCSVSSTNTPKTRRSLIVHPRRRFHRRLLHVSSHRHCWHCLHVGHSLHVGHVGH